MGNTIKRIEIQEKQDICHIPYCKFHLYKDDLCELHYHAIEKLIEINLTKID